MAITKASFGGREERAMPMSDDDDDDDDRAGKTTKIKGAKGKPPITFKKGGLHESLGVPEGEKIPESKLAAAKAGRYGPKAQKQANFAKALEKMRPGSRGTLSPADRTLAADAGIAVVPTAVLGAPKKRAKGGK